MTRETLPPVESASPWTPNAIGQTTRTLGAVGPRATGTPDLLDVDPFDGTAEPGAWARGLSFDQARQVIGRELGDGPLVGTNGQTLQLVKQGTVRLRGPGGEVGALVNPNRSWMLVAALAVGLLVLGSS